MADTQEHNFSRPGQPAHAAREHNPYNPYSRDSSIPEGTPPARSTTYPSKQASVGGSYEMHDSHDPHLQKDPEAGKSVKRGGMFDGEFMNRPICNMRMKWFIVLVTCFVLGAVAAALAGILGSERAIEDNKVKIAQAAEVASKSVASVMATATATGGVRTPTA